MEKRLSVRYQKIIGTPVFPPGIFCGEAVFEREDEPVRTHRGKLFALLSIIGPKNFDSALSFKIILDCLEEEYFRDTEGSPLVALERTALSASHRFIDLTLGGTNLSGSTEFNLILAVSWGQVLYLSKVGAATVCLLRGGVVKEIVLGEEAKVSTASGLIAPGDVLILGTHAFKEHFPPETILSVLPRLEEEISKRREKDIISALVVKFDLEEVPAKNEVIRFAHQKSVSPRFVFSALQPLAFSLRSFFSNLKMPLKLRRPREIFLKGRTGLPKVGSDFKPRLIILLLFSLFVGSVFWTLRSQNQRQLVSESKKLLAEAQTKITTAGDLVDLNNSRAKNLLEEALENLGKVERYGFNTAAVEPLRQRARDLLSIVTKEKIKTPKMLYDFSLQDKNNELAALSLAASEGGEGRLLFVADRLSGNIFELSVGNGKVSVQKIDKGALKNPLFLSVFADNLYGVDQNGVFSISLKGSSVKTGLVSTQEFENLADFKSYLGNFYFLVPESGGILKSLVLEGPEYTKPVRWLKENRDLSKASSFAIDGSIFVLDSSGRILKFEAGRPADFSLSGTEFSLSSSAALYTDSLTSLLYIFDAKEAKIIVLSKEGIYQSQLRLEGGNFSSEKPIFVVDEKSKKAYFLVQSRLFEVDLE